LLRALLECGADVDRVGLTPGGVLPSGVEEISSTCTAVSMAIQLGRVECVKVLLAAGASLDIRRLRRLPGSLLIDAVKGGQVELVELLVRAGLKDIQCDMGGLKARDHAKLLGRHPMAREMLDLLSWCSVYLNTMTTAEAEPSTRRQGNAAEAAGQRENRRMGLRHREDAEIADLENRLIIECPREGESVDQFERRRGLVDAEGEEHQRFTTGPVLTGHAFGELPLSRKTQLGLKDHGFTKLTPIQRSAIPYALAGRD
ncbi:ATPdependent RNA helicase, partial [Perkinsus olseni]